MRSAAVLLLLCACSGASEPEEVSEVTAVASEGEASPPAEEQQAEPSEQSQGQAASGPSRLPARDFEPGQFPAPGAESALPPAVGQWVRYRTVFRSGGTAETEYRLVEQVGDEWVLEVTDQRRSTRHFRMQLRLNTPSPAGVHHALTALSFDNAQGRENVPERVLGSFEEMLRPWLTMVFPPMVEGPAEEVRVPAGTFAGATRGQREVAFGAMQIRGQVHLHPAVPITSLVRFEVAGEQPHRMELIAFGLTGAEAHFPSSEAQGAAEETPEQGD